MGRQLSVPCPVVTYDATTRSLDGRDVRSVSWRWVRDNMMVMVDRRGGGLEQISAISSDCLRNWLEKLRVRVAQKGSVDADNLATLADREPSELHVPEVCSGTSPAPRGCPAFRVPAVDNRTEPVPRSVVDHAHPG